MVRQKYRLQVEDKPGVLMRVAGIITAKGANIAAVTLREDGSAPGCSVLEIEADLEERFRGRVLNEMNRLVQVIDAVMPPFPDGPDGSESRAS